MTLLWIGAAFVFAGFIQKVFESVLDPKNKCPKTPFYTNECINCSYAHKETGLNYSWLNKEFGKVLKIEFEEPVDKNNLNSQGKPIYDNEEMVGNWQPYTDKIWDIHCKPNVIDHSPSKLVDQHLAAFVNPQSRFARLKFTLHKNDKIYQMEPTKRFYELEKDFFLQRSICQ